MIEFPLVPEVKTGETADVYFHNAKRVLVRAGQDPEVGVRIFCRNDGTLCGIREAGQLLRSVGFEGTIETMHDGASLVKGQPAMHVRCRYSHFCIYETAVLGILASGTGWATAAKQCVLSAGGKPVVSYGARHVHPNVAGSMDYAATVAGCTGCSTHIGSRLAGTAPMGTMPHAMVLVLGDTLTAANYFDQTMESNIPRIVLVDTFQDEAVETLRIAQNLGKHLHGVRLDTCSERGGVRAARVWEIRMRLDQAGYEHVKIMVSGGFTPEKIAEFEKEGTPVDSYGVGSYISGARPVDFTADIVEINGYPKSKIGRWPGLTKDERLTSTLIF